MMNDSRRFLTQQEHDNIVASLESAWHATEGIKPLVACLGGPTINAVLKLQGNISAMRGELPHTVAARRVQDKGETVLWQGAAMRSERRRLTPAEHLQLARVLRGFAGVWLPDAAAKIAKTVFWRRFRSAERNCQQLRKGASKQIAQSGSAPDPYYGERDFALLEQLLQEVGE